VRKYTVLVSREGAAYLVSVPALPGCHTFGYSLEEALANAREAIELVILTLQDRGEPIPEETEPIQAITVEVAA
jgi:antitoxin HicB